MIELNASCNRNGKRIVTDLMEATQSHAVEKNYLLNLIKGIIFIIYIMFIEYRLTSESVLSSKD